MSHIPASAGVFKPVTVKRQIRGRTIRVRTLVLVSHDGFVVERLMSEVFRRGPRLVNEEMAAEVNAIRGRAVYAAQLEAAQAAPAPKTYERCSKAPPVATVAFVPHPEKLTDSQLISVLEERGYDVAIK